MDDSPSFFLLLSQYVDLDDFIPNEFRSAFYHSLGHNRLYSLHAFLTALILQKIFSIPMDSLLLLFLNICKELRDFCGFLKVPDASLLSHFKPNFESYIENTFQKMVDYTEPICQMIDSSLAQMLTFDTSGIELYVTENNPKTLNALIKHLKAYYKNKPDVDPYKLAYSLMPSQASSCSDAKQMYISGHFCFADKFAILTNRFGIVRHLSFIDDADFKSAHPDLAVEKKNDSPNEDKSVGDASALVPVLTDFFFLHPDLHPDIFLGDSKHCGVTKEKGRADQFQWLCPKMHYHKGWTCGCESPCSAASKGRTTYTYENMDLRMFPGIQWDSDEWNDTYKIRTIIERTIHHFKINMCIAGRKTRNHTTTKADVFLAGIASQLTVIVANTMNCPIVHSIFEA